MRIGPFDFAIVRSKPGAFPLAASLSVTISVAIKISIMDWLIGMACPLSAC